MQNKQWLDFQFDNLLVATLGSEGAMYKYQKEGLYEYITIPITEDHPVRDLSGAGDTFMAALVADYIKNKDIRSAIRFANKCASWVVTQKGVVVVDLNKIKI
jgi:sugar/nucleoside kinase (ribokinase family)